MANNDKPVDSEIISCEICMKEVPLSDAIAPETHDYVAHFCGLACYAQWKAQDGKKSKDGGK